jgi:hypothetical protein
MATFSYKYKIIKKYPVEFHGILAAANIGKYF